MKFSAPTGLFCQFGAPVTPNYTLLLLATCLLEPRLLALLYPSTQLQKEERDVVLGVQQKGGGYSPPLGKDQVHQDTPVMLLSFLLGTSWQAADTKGQNQESREPKNERMQKNDGVSPAYFWDAAMPQSRLKWICLHTGCTVIWMNHYAESSVPCSKCCSPIYQRALTK